MHLSPSPLPSTSLSLSIANSLCITRSPTKPNSGYCLKTHTTLQHIQMSSRRSSSSRSRHVQPTRSSSSGIISDDQIIDLVSKLNRLVPEGRSTTTSRRSRDRGSSASKVLQETCNYIRGLQREVEDLSERLSELLASTDSDSAQAAIIRSLLM